jgi:hypothetical protein
MFLLLTGFRSQILWRSNSSDSTHDALFNSCKALPSYLGCHKLTSRTRQAPEAEPSVEQEAYEEGTARQEPVKSDAATCHRFNEIKLIDVYPDEVAGQPSLGGYQLRIAMDIFRGRYRESFANPKPIEPNKPLT